MESTPQTRDVLVPGVASSMQRQYQRHSLPNPHAALARYWSQHWQPVLTECWMPELEPAAKLKSARIWDGSTVPVLAFSGGSALENQHWYSNADPLLYASTGTVLPSQMRADFNLAAGSSSGSQHLISTGIPVAGWH